jgi:hypothetical protein
MGIKKALLLDYSKFFEVLTINDGAHTDESI